jgi:ABC-type sugar transport system permease subunit
MSGLLVRVLGLLAFDVAIIWFVIQAYSLGFIPLVIVLGVVILMVNVVFLVERLEPLRWMVIGLSFMVIFVIYPIVFTVYVAFTNYGDGHLLTKQQALDQILVRTYLPEEGQAYKWTAFKTENNDYAIWLQSPSLTEQGIDGLLAKPGEEIVEGIPGENGLGELDASGIPASLEGYTKLNAILAATDPNLPEVKFGVEGSTVQIRSPSEAAELLPRYVYDEDADTIFDEETQQLFTNVEGTYSAQQGDTIKPGYREVIGWKNFSDFFTSPSLRGPLFTIMTWNFIFPIISVLSTFALGLLIAIMYNDPEFPFKKIIRSFLLIPYTIPGLITIIIWRGMMNPELGVINRTLETWFNFSAPWFTDPTWAKGAILLVNLWLGYPYFMLICSGALQSIPSSLYEAASIDGANGWQKFRNITLPLLLVAVGPLLIASYVFNFNNFNLIYLFIAGGPPIAGATTQAGHTDILISYVYKLAFEGGGRGVLYGFASAITIVIFFVVGAITLFQFRFTNMWEEVGENV